MKILSSNRITIATIALFTVAVIFSCKKEASNSDPVTEEESLVYSEESMEAEASYDDVQDISMVAAEEEANVSLTGRVYPFVALRARIGNCADITVSPNDSTYPKTVTIDFGNGCVGLDGKFRKGAIILHFTGPIRRPGSVLTITFRDFYLNRAHIEGTKIISNLSENGDIKFTVQVVDGKVIYPNGRGYKYNALKYVKQIEGGLTNDVMDDIFSIEGRSNTQFNNGVSIALNTESPLIKKASCAWINKGVLKIKINNRVLLLNYGAPNDGDCDNKALLTWNNGANQRLITLP
jgi:hypothetical protein